MTFIVETFINPNEFMKPNSLIKFLRIDYNNLIRELTQSYKYRFRSNSFALNYRLKLKRNINKIMLDLFDAYTRLVADETRLSNNLTTIKAQLDTFKINNVELKEELARMYELSDGSSELIHDYKKLYNINYTKNWGIFLSIIFSCYVLYTMFKSKPITL
jgi:hypothetical protein